ncbi:MAG TPA: family 16 glycoside hydrolase [Pedobacter sp.]|uniref:family 16 glycoside hydrolase n=1 Tax=Pedobacter sp. TaxID=1411316 RepID=UPI002B599364|nr:family 16 glycoside hydrolase [Pedobacter sp.]HMI04098.1 family 16 glycoside hydrolase [Pedobacter sp.]
MKFGTIILLAALTVSTTLRAQEAVKISIGKISGTFNRNVTLPEDGSSLTVNEGPGAGGAWLRLKEVVNAEIEVEMKGRDVLQRSFLGIAFHAQNDSTYEAVYFRPFNFRAADPDRVKHAVQYVSLPGNDWPKLRKEYPLKYEQPVNVSLNPDDWFRVRLVFADGNVTVYVNGEEKPCLEVKSLSNYKSGKVGLWTGNNSPGEFRNLTVKRSGK